MSSCVSVATETQFGTQVVTSNSISTFFSTSVSTADPTIVTSKSTSCLDQNASSSCTSSTVIDVTTTVPGSTTTVSVPITTTVAVVRTDSSATRTLFSTSCVPTTSPTSPSTSNPTTSTPTSAPESTLSETTPPPVTFTSETPTTLSNGSVVTTDLVLTSTSPPTSVYVTSSAPAFNSDRSGGSSKKIAPIVGGVVGGVLGLLALIGGIWFVWRRSKRWNDIFDREEDEKEQRRRMSLDGEDVQPRPYHYGLVGQSTSPSPPNSPPLGASDRGPGHSPSNSLSLLSAADRVHSRSSSNVDASPGSMSRSASDLATPIGHTRPNLSNASTGSTMPLLERSVNNSRPTSSRSAGAGHAGPSVELFGGERVQSTSLTPRPRSAGDPLPSGAAAAAIPRAFSTDIYLSPASEKRRLRETLPLGAAAPTPPSSAIHVPPLPGPAPPLTPRSPRRPASAGNGIAHVHSDGGPTSWNAPSTRDGNQPPAYSPT